VREAQQNAAGLLTIGSIAAGVVNYAYTLVMTYHLAPSQFAVFAGAQALVLVVGIVGSAGVPWVLARETARAVSDFDHGRLQQAVNFAFWANVGVGLLAAVGTGGIVLLFGSPLDAALVAATSFVLCVGSTGLGFLQGEGRTTAIAAIIFAEVLVKFAVGLFLVTETALDAAAPLAGALAGAFVPFVAVGAVVRYVGLPRSLHIDAALWRAAGRIGLLQVGVGVISSLDTVLAASLPGVRGSAAAYQVASTVGKVPLFVSSAVSTAVFPTMTVGDALRARVHALRVYAMVAGFVWVVLITAPPELVLALFPAEYGSFIHWLPYTAPFGVALGLLNLLTTFVQSGWTGRTGGLAPMAVSVLVAAGAMLAGATLGGVRGLAIGALVGSVLCVGIFGRLPSERGALRAVPGGAGQAARRSLVAAALVIVLVVCRMLPVLWLGVVVVAGLAVTVVAFPEFRRPFRDSGTQAR
jgi:O-antigen/teichoic acid export membrane protein